MDLFTRKLVAATALSDRYAVAEQDLIKKLGEESGGFFTNPVTSATRFKELLRAMQNDLERHRAGLENRGANVLNKLPAGTKNDPFEFSGQGQFNYIMKVGRDPAANLNGKYMRMTVQQALNRNLLGRNPNGTRYSPAQLSGMDPNDPVLIHLGDE